MEKKRKKPVKLGDIYALQLPSSKFAFGRIFKESCIGIYTYFGTDIEDIPTDETYLFNVGIYKYAIQSEEWIKVANKPFENEEDSWPPPQCIIDAINGSYSLYHKGIISSSSKLACEGLEKVAAWDTNHILDRIMGEDKWHKRKDTL